MWICEAGIPNVKVVLNAFDSSKFFFFKRLEPDTVDYDRGLSSPRSGVGMMVGSHWLDVVPKSRFRILRMSYFHLRELLVVVGDLNWYRSWVEN